MARRSSRIAERQGNNNRRGQGQPHVEAVNQGGNVGTENNVAITPAMVATMVQEAVAQAMQGIPQVQENQHANNMGGDAEIPQHEQNNPPEDQVGQPVQPLYVLLERFIKQKPKSFRSAPTPIDAENWIAHLEKIFYVIGCSKNQKVRLAVYKLEDDAQRWWKSLKATQGDGFMDALTWSDFCDFFYQQYFSNADRDAYTREFVSIRQKEDETITDFMARFTRLAGFVGPIAGTAAQQAEKFKWALKFEYRRPIIHTIFSDVSQVANAAKSVEMENKYFRASRAEGS